MVFVAGEGQGILEIWDLSRGGDHPLKKSLDISQNLEIGKLFFRVSRLCEHKMGSFGLILQCDRVKIDLMEVRRDFTLNDIGVDFTSGSTYSLLITEGPSSPSEDDEQVELNDNDTRKLTEIGVDLSSPSSVMLLVTETAESPSAENATKTTTPAEDYPPATTSPETEQTQERTENQIKFDGNCYVPREYITSFNNMYQTSSSSISREGMSAKDTRETEETYRTAHEGDGEMVTEIEVFSEPAESNSKRYTTRYDPPEEDVNTYSDTSQSRTGYRRNHKVRTSFQTKRMNREIDDDEPNRCSQTAYVGLVNQAMTCYLNSLIQALYMTPEFRNALYNWEYPSGSEKDEVTSIPYQLQKLFLNLQTSSKNAIETTSLTKSFGWDSTEAWQQHDIQELCRVMFDALEQKFKKTEQADLINRLYEGKMIDYVKCLECETEKSREDTFLDIPLPVKPFGSNVAYNSVEEALAAFVQPETLDGANQYHCETCNKKCDAHKGLKFTKFPYLLTLHLKRFDFDYNTFHRIKLNDEVTFPDVLNLNSFIPSTTSQDSPCAEEDNGVGVKCDDSSTTDSGTLDDECPPCDNGMSVSDHSANHDHDYDEGIDMSNGPSTSSYNAHNHDNEKNRGNRAGPSGPYEYELFSIMIHSGSASGGHYYAYIKDFRTGEWLCFNDQNVSPITDDDIQKTYGGGPTRAYYSGVYSSSTNAYMLMYRQVDPVRNTLPMQVADFPKHLQELLAKMQDNENNDIKSQVMMRQMPKIKVMCQCPNEKTKSKALSCAKLSVQPEETWAELTGRAHKTLCPEIDQDLVRLVPYNEASGMIECSFDGREDELVTNLLTDRSDLLLEIRKKDEKFKTYLPGGFLTKVCVIDVAKKEVVKGPITVRGVMSQTVLEYKEQLGELLGMEPKDIDLILQYPNHPPTRLAEINETQSQMDSFMGVSKIFVPMTNDADSTKSIQDSIPEIMEVFGSLIWLNFELPDTSKEALRELSIPSLEEIGNEKPAETPVTNGPTKLSSGNEGAVETIEKTDGNSAIPLTKVAASDETSFWNETTSPPAAQPEGEEWHTPEQSNSEDSSLSYSDRTLVGEGDASEDDDYPQIEVFSEPAESNSKRYTTRYDPPEEDVNTYPDTSQSRTHYRRNHKVTTSFQTKRMNREIDYDEPNRRSQTVAGVDHEFFGQTEQENWDAEDAREHLFKATLDEGEPEKMLRVLVDKRMSLGALKKLLEPYVGVPAEYFKIYRQCGSETECSRLSAQMNFHEDGEVLTIKLGRALRSGEFKVKLHQLIIDSDRESYKFLCEWIVSKEATVGQTKKEILAELSKKFDLDIPLERCRLRRKNYKTASKVFLDDQKFKDLNLYWPFEIIVQELPGKEPVTDPNDVVLFVRRVMKPDVYLGPIEEIVVSGKSNAEIREKLSEISGIPEEFLEMARGKSTMAWDLMVLMFETVVEWNRQIPPPDNRPPMGLDDGSFIYYRDWREKVDDPNAKDSQHRVKAKSHMLGISSSSRYSPRRERALKIYVDDK